MTTIWFGTLVLIELAGVSFTRGHTLTSCNQCDELPLALAWRVSAHDDRAGVGFIDVASFTP